MSDKCYSLDDEEFNFDEFGDLLDQMDDPKIGDTYFEADYEPLTADDVINVNTILEQMDEQAYDLTGEAYDNECSDVPDAAKAELQALLCAWAEKYINLSRYWVIVGKTRECKLAAEDLI